MYAQTDLRLCVYMQHSFSGRVSYVFNILLKYLDILMKYRNYYEILLGSGFRIKYVIFYITRFAVMLLI